MDTLSFTTTINAPVTKVWEVMLADASYREWTAAFHPGSYFEGSWNQGDTIRFVSVDDGVKSGMLGKIAELVPNELVVIEYLGEVVNGQDDTSSDEATAWAGSHETYRFSESDGVTTLVVELESDQDDEDMAEMFKGMWPQALAKLKGMCER